MHLNGLDSTSMSPLSWGRSAIGNSCQSSNFEQDPVQRQSPLGSWKLKWPTLPVPLVRPSRCTGKHQLKCLRKAFHLPKKSVMCYVFFNYVHSTVRKPSGYQHLHTSSWAVDSMGTCTRELGGLRSLNSYEAKLVAHAKCNCFISLFQQVFGVSQSWKTSSEGLGPRNDNPFRT